MCGFLSPAQRLAGLGVCDHWDPFRNICKVHLSAVSHLLTLWQEEEGAGPTHKCDLGSLPALDPPPTDIRRWPAQRSKVDSTPGLLSPGAISGLGTRPQSGRDVALEYISTLLFQPILGFPGG